LFFPAEFAIITLVILLVTIGIFCGISFNWYRY